MTRVLRDECMLQPGGLTAQPAGKGGIGAQTEGFKGEISAAPLVDLLSESEYADKLLRHVPQLVFKIFNATSLKAPVSVHLCKKQLKDISEVLRKSPPVGLFAMIKSALCIAQLRLC
eukprot:1152303-Pelagomonas_calceolata.AAC.1